VFLPKARDWTHTYRKHANHYTIEAADKNNTITNSICSIISYEARILQSDWLVTRV
jgi:hypothetical protein